MRPRAIEVHIAELVLHGVAPPDALRIGAAAERELAGLLRERGLPDALAGAEVGAVDAGAFARPSPTGPAAIGTQIARAVYGSLAR